MKTQASAPEPSDRDAATPTDAARPQSFHPSPKQTRTLAERIRSARIEREIERLRPIGESYVLRRFGGRLNAADAQDAVADAIVHLDRRVRRGEPIANLRAFFFTAARNAAISELRRPRHRTEVALEAALDRPASTPDPQERVEQRADAAAVREALAHMRPNYREVIALRFGAGMTNSEIAAHKQLNRKTVDQLMVRAIRQVERGLDAVTSREHCAEIQRLARRAVFERYLAGVADDAEASMLQRHLDHCGRCMSFLSELRHNLHELGSALLFTTAASDRLAHKAGVLDHVSSWISQLGEGSHAVADKARIAAHKATAPLASTDASLSVAYATSGHNLAAICGAGVATVATCLAGVVSGPTLGPNTAATDKPAHPPPTEIQAPAPANQYYGYTAGRHDYPTYDMIRIMPNGQTFWRYIWTDPCCPNSRYVVGAQNPSVGEYVCASGMTTRAICGVEVIGVNATLCDASGCTPNLFKASKPGTTVNRPGDSGAPVYQRFSGSDAGIRGMVIGRTQIYNFLAHKVSTIKNHLGVTGIAG